VLRRNRMVYIRWSPPCSCESNIRKLATVNASKQVRKALQKEKQRVIMCTDRWWWEALTNPIPPILGCPRSGKTRSSLDGPLREPTIPHPSHPLFTQVCTQALVSPRRVCLTHPLAFCAA
jgi:hypothetical protein